MRRIEEINEEIEKVLNALYAAERKVQRCVWRLDELMKEYKEAVDVKD